MIRVKGQTERGFEIKFIKLNSLAKNPKSIRKERLSATESKIVSVVSIFSRWNILRRRNPGMNVRKTKPKICLTNGISKKIAIIEMD